MGDATVPEERITSLVRDSFSLTPKAIIEALDLRRPIYKETARNGHFGREFQLVKSFLESYLARHTEIASKS